MKNEQSTEKPRKCRACDKKIQLGEDVLTIEIGVMGPRGIVPLHDADFFCCEQCVVGHFADGLTDIQKLTRRIP